jgi:hypothetical protein
LRESSFGIGFVVPGGDRDFLAWTEKLHLVALYNHDLPKAIGFVESYRRYVLTRFVEQLGAIAHRSPFLYFVILPFPQILDGVDTADDIARRNTREQQDSDGCIRIARGSV